MAAKGGAADDGDEKLIDVDKLLSLCTVRLRMPERKERPKSAIAGFARTATGGLMEMGSKSARALGPVGAAAAGASTQAVAKASAAGTQAATAASAAGGSALKELGDRMPTIDLEAQAPTPPRRPCWLSCLCMCLCACPRGCYACSTCACCPGPCRRPTRSAIVWLMEKVRVRVSVAPVLMVAGWGALRWAIAATLDFLGPVLAAPWRPLVSILLPYVAVCMALSAIVAQAYFVSLPIARGIAVLLQDLGDIIDYAFSELLEVLPNTISSLVVSIGVPERLVGRVVKVLFTPLRQALREVMALIPRVDEVFPAWSKRPTPLVPFLWAGLLTGLVFAQALVLLMAGMNGAGDAAIALGVLLCNVLGAFAVHADRIMPNLLWLVETVINVSVQFLMRRVLQVEKLQAGIDLALKGAEVGAKAVSAGAGAGEGAIVRAAKPVLDRASVKVLHGSLVKQINGGLASA